MNATDMFTDVSNAFFIFGMMHRTSMLSLQPPIFAIMSACFLATFI